MSLAGVGKWAPGGASRRVLEFCRSDPSDGQCPSSEHSAIAGVQTKPLEAATTLPASWHPRSWSRAPEKPQTHTAVLPETCPPAKNSERRQGDDRHLTSALRSSASISNRSNLLAVRTIAAKESGKEVPGIPCSAGQEDTPPGGDAVPVA